MNDDNNRVILIPVDDIIPNRFQPRLKFNEKELQSLAESISEHGIVSPIIVRKIGDKYEIIAGERRFKAAGLIGLNTVPCIVKNLDDTESAEVAVIENLQRANLTPIEEARSYDKLLAKGMTQEQLGKRLGIAQSTIANKIRLLNLAPYVQEILLQNKISERHARSLLQLPNFTMQKEVCDNIIANRLTVRQTDAEINRLLGKNVTNEADNSDVDDDSTIETLPEIDNMPEVSAPKVSFEALLRKDLPIAALNNNEDSEQDSGLELTDIPAIIDVDRVQAEAKESMEAKEKENPFGKFDFIKEEAINPFQNVTKTEPTETFDIPADPISPKGPSVTPAVDFNKPAFEPNTPAKSDEMPTKRSFAPAVNSVRDVRRKLEEQGYRVDSEEFDFEDMYQIVIKIKKD